MIPTVIGTVAGSYRITDVVSVGGMGTVYRAVHTLIGRVAAVKVLNPEYAANKDLVGRFFTEARVTTSIKHPGIVEVYDFGQLEGGHAYLIMEFLEGAPLSARNKQRGPVGEGEAAAILRGVCSALAAAHAKGVVHRDLKPDNIFIVPDPDAPLGLRPKLLDFGIAKLTDIGLAGTATRTGAVMGTPTYMSPEQCSGSGRVDHRADLYSIGCIFYELVTGRPPFTMLGAGELIAAHMMVPPGPPSSVVAGLSPDTEALIMSLLAKRPEERPQTAAELGQRLSAIARRSGLPSATSWETAHSSAPDAATLAVTTPGMGTPMPTPSARMSSPMPTPGAPMPTPGAHAPMPTPGAYAPLPTPGIADKPTTLSSVASHSIASAPSRGSRFVIFGVALTAVIVGGVVATLALKDRGSSTTPASSPEPTTAPAVTMPATPPPMPETSPPAQQQTPAAPPAPPPPTEVTLPREQPTPPREEPTPTPPETAQKPPEPPVKKEPKKKPPKKTVTKPAEPSTDPLLESDI